MNSITYNYFCICSPDGDLKNQIALANEISSNMSRYGEIERLELFKLYDTIRTFYNYILLADLTGIP